MLCVSCSHPRTVPYRALPARRTPRGTPSTSSAYPPCQSRTADSKSAMLAPVCPSPLLPSPPQPPSRLASLLHTHQNPRRRLLWHRPPLRLAWHPSSQYTPLPHAVRRRRPSRVGRKASSRSEEDEKEVGGRLGRVQEAQRARGPFSSHSPTSPLTPPIVSPRNPVPPMHHTPLRLLSPPRHQGALLCFREHGGQSISSRQGSKGPSPRRWPRGLHLPTNCLRPPPHTCFGLFSQGHEARECSRHHNRSL
jgi:hypothetical protein